jgi:hypothetical protein
MRSMNQRSGGNQAPSADVKPRRRRSASLTSEIRTREELRDAAALKEIGPQPYVISPSKGCLLTPSRALKCDHDVRTPEGDCGGPRG